MQTRVRTCGMLILAVTCQGTKRSNQSDAVSVRKCSFHGRSTAQEVQVAAPNRPELGEDADGDANPAAAWCANPRHPHWLTVQAEDMRSILVFQWNTVNKVWYMHERQNQEGPVLGCKPQGLQLNN